jgi:hypothetical protein
MLGCICLHDCTLASHCTGFSKQGCNIVSLALDKPRVCLLKCHLQEAGQAMGAGTGRQTMACLACARWHLHVHGWLYSLTAWCFDD